MVRDELQPRPTSTWPARADLLVLQPLRPDEATLVGAALGLGEAAQWLTRIRADMVGVVNRRAVRWAAAVPDPDRGPADRPAGPRLTGATRRRADMRGIRHDIAKIAECRRRGLAQAWHHPVPWASSSGW